MSRLSGALQAASQSLLLLFFFSQFDPAFDMSTESRYFIQLFPFWAIELVGRGSSLTIHSCFIEIDPISKATSPMLPNPLKGSGDFAMDAR